MLSYPSTIDLSSQTLQYLAMRPRQHGAAERSVTFGSAYRGAGEGRHCAQALFPSEDDPHGCGTGWAGRFTELDDTAASSAGVTFYAGNEHVWLVDHVSARYITPV